jgi:hypothetical protein
LIEVCYWLSYVSKDEGSWMKLAEAGGSWRKLDEAGGSWPKLAEAVCMRCLAQDSNR